MLITKLTYKKKDEAHGDVIPLHAASSSTKNHYTVLIGPNGTQKSLTLRRIVDSLFRLKTVSTPSENIKSVITVGKNDSTTLEWRQENVSAKELFSVVIAISGVANDRFPSKSTGLVANRTKYDEEFYIYVGPRTASNIVSRSQSIHQLALLLLLNWKRLRPRWKKIARAFDLVQVSRNLLFSIGRAPGSDSREMDRYIQNSDALKGRISRSLSKYQNPNVPPSAAIDLKPKIVELLQNEDVLKACQELLKVVNRSPRAKDSEIEIGIDLDDSDGDEIPFPPEAFYLLLESKLIRVSSTMILTEDDQAETLDRLSSGQWQVLSSCLSLCLAIENNAVVLVDEPENSLHPEWAREYFSYVDEILSIAKGCHIIVATHSPLVASTMPNSRTQIVTLKREKYSTKIVATVMEESSYGWTSDDILTHVFGLSTSRNVEFEALVNEALKIIAAGDTQNAQLAVIARHLLPLRDTLPNTDAGVLVLDSIIKLSGIGATK